MKGSKYLATIDGALHKSRILVVAFGISMAFNVLSWIAWYNAKSHTQTVILPTDGEGVTIGNGQADPRYLRRMARYITNMTGTWSAATARQQFQELATIFAPEKVTAAATYFDGIATDIERYPSISSQVTFAGSDPLKFTKTMLQVRAQKERLVNGMVTERNQIYYCLSYRIEDSRFWLVNIAEKEGNSVDPCMPKVDAEGRPVADKPAQAAGTAAAPKQ